MRFGVTTLHSVVEVVLLSCEHDALEEEETDGVGDVTFESENTGGTGSTLPEGKVRDDKREKCENGTSRIQLTTDSLLFFPRPRIASHSVTESSSSLSEM
jgi:hypothetical protein